MASQRTSYNLQGANAYLGAVVPLVVLSLVLPTFTVTTKGPTLSNAQQAFVVLAAVGLYTVFLAMQTGRHRGYFTLAEDLGEDEAREARRAASPGPASCSAPIWRLWFSWPNSWPIRSTM